ncbi:MAG TPA: sulfatase-like hydrolase/transferase [Anaerolineales bacterium]|nr:sulfatase-like hydrolase/transferase [Anaerolineales bacterium]
MLPFRGLTRREFLKLISLVPIGIYSRPISKLTAAPKVGSPNIIIIVFDAWSQHHVSLYGYHRHNMPNLEKFAEKATVYYNHYSTGSFTVPGTSSILTGMHPWSHRAFQLGAGITAEHAEHTIFSALSSTHSTLAYSQNKFADLILHQASMNLDRHVDYWSFNVQNTNMYSNSFLRKHHRTSFASIDDNLVQEGEGFDSSLFLGPLVRLFTLNDRLKNTEQHGNEYPLGLPDATELFLLPDVVDGAIDLLEGIQQPTLTYLHFFPPHEPYTPTVDFFGSFSDGWSAPDKLIHDLSDKKYKTEKLRLERQYYDEFIASWDHETARLFQYLEDSGLTENSYIIITSDHGEMFERGELGHWTPLLYDPVVHVPLIISSPGQTARRDVHSLTSSVDLLPTLAHLTSNPIPDWAEGKVLPELGGEVDEGRSVFSLDAKTNSSFGPLRNFSMSLTRGRHRLAYYSYPKDEYEKFEFYDLEADREELKDLYPSRPSLADEMRDELLQKVSEVNKPFQRNES